MKKPGQRTLAFLLVAFSCCSLAGADARAYILTGVGGLTTTHVNGTCSGDFSSNGVGWLFGGLVNVTTSIGTGLEGGLLIGRRKLTQTTASGSNAATTVDVTQTYAEIPAEWLWRFSRMFFVSTGLYYLQAMGTTYNAHLATNGAVPVANTASLPSVDIGAAAGLGGEFPIAAQSAIRAEARFDAGLLASYRAREGMFFLGYSRRF